MRYRYFNAVGALVAIAAVVSVIPSPVDVSALVSAADDFTPSRTPWGDPNLQGIWGLGYTFTALERPDNLGEKQFLTDAEISVLEQQHREGSGDGAGGRARAEVGTDEDLAGAYNQAFSAFGQHERIIRTKRTSLIIDPANGKIPYTPDAKERVAAELASAQATADRADGPEDRPNDRCDGVQLPFVKGISGTFSRIVQTPDSVAMYYEEGHRGGGYRYIPLDGRPHFPQHIRQWMGDARGRWDGDTLVVETTNFTSKTDFNGSRENLQLVERYTQVAEDLILQEVTVTDPTTFSQSWTIEVPLTKGSEQQNQIFESACHEGNYAMVSILAGARTLERQNQ
jgi:hypothetical protein